MRKKYWYVEIDVLGLVIVIIAIGLAGSLIVGECNQ